jgi:hypothetical protein
MAPRSKLFALKMGLQKQKPERRKIGLGSIPSEDGFL